MNYNEAMEYIVNTAKFGSKYGLERIEKTLEFLGNPHKSLKCIHIGGTNGKGSTTSMISTILMNSGYKVGSFISPYIEEFEERIQVNNTNISKENLCKIVEKVSLAVEKVVSVGYEHPTEFEIITCCMFLYFYEIQVDYVVLEVGLGGKLDCTNVITPLVSVITSVSFDHMNILGNTIQEIATEKSGIIKNNIPVVLYPSYKEALEVLEKSAREKNSDIIKVRNEDVKFISIEEYKQKAIIKTANESYEITLALLGTHQLLNCAVAINTIEILQSKGLNKITKDIILKSLSEVKWPGRLEIMNKEPLVVIDGAHNIDGIEKLTQNIKTYFKYNNLYLILGILGDKEVYEMVKTICPLAKEVITVTPNNYRATQATDLCEVVKPINKNVSYIEDYKEAYLYAKNKLNDDDLLVVSGSLYMIGDMRKIIKNM